MFVRLALLLWMLGLSSILLANTDDELSSDEALEESVVSKNPDEDLMTGLTIDDTVSRFGREFYRNLAQHRRSNFPDETDNLVVRERPSARWGTIIWVEAMGERVYYRRISSGGNDIKALAEQASVQITRTIRKMKLEKMLKRSKDLADDEIQL